MTASAKLATPISEADHAQGPADAAIMLVQYGDYECPYTRLSRHSVHQLQREFPDSLRFVFRHFPLEEIHPHARAASAAAEAAAQQTDFWTMHAYLFEHQKALDIEAISELVQLADTTGLDMVAIQDHAYNHTFLETWTLIAFLAAKRS